MFVSVSVLQVRHYDSVKWVSTDKEAHFMDKAIVTTFMRLFKYITRSNRAGVCVCVYFCVCTSICVCVCMHMHESVSMLVCLPGKMCLPIHFSDRHQH